MAESASSPVPHFGRMARPPAPLDLEDLTHRGENWRRCARDWNIYELASKLSEEKDEVRVAALLNIIGYEALDMYDTFEWGNSPEDKHKIKEVLKKFQERLVPETNETFERYNFCKRHQEAGEATNAYITAVMKLAVTCNFGALKDSHIRDRLVSGIRDDGVRRKLLGKRDLTLTKCLEILRSSQITQQRAQEIATEERETHALTAGRQSGARNATATESPPGYRSRQPKGKCGYCGLEHAPKKEDCPAAGKTCMQCKKKGHYARVCRSKAAEEPTQKERVKYVEAQEDVVYVELNHINTSTTNKAYSTFTVADTSKKVKFQIDTGASCNHGRTTVGVTGDKQAANFTETRTVLVMHNKTKVTPRGSAELILQRNGHTYKVRLLVIPGSTTPLLSLKSSQQLGLVKIVDSDHLHTVKQQPVTPEAASNYHDTDESENHHDTDESEDDTIRDPILQEHKAVFEGLGCLPGHYSIQIDNTATPVVHAARKAPVALRDAIQEELEKLTKEGVLEPVTEPTPWVSSMVTVRKKNNKVRICIDPQDLNRSIRRAYTTPSQPQRTSQPDWQMPRSFQC